MEGLFKNKYKIQSIRLSEYDYSLSGFYFVTICTHERVEYFGDVARDNGGEYSVALSDVGMVVRDGLLNIPAIYNNVRLDEWVIMPNHIHVIFEITSSLRNTSSNDFVETPHWGVSTRERKPQHHIEWKPGVLGSIINQFKGAVTRQCHALGLDFHWQPRFYDHIIRNEMALDKIRQYIRANPARWYRDRNNPENIWY